MISKILSYFPPHTHPLTVVSDPDRLLSGEKLMRELIQRGFRIIQDEDPVILRFQIAESLPITENNPVIVITSKLLVDMPYDLWQPAHRVTFSLHHFFPKLSYPVLQTLLPDQIEKLALCPAPKTTLSRNKTLDYILKQVFEVELNALTQPSKLIDWLNDYHQHASPLPEVFRSYIVNHLNAFPDLKAWDLDLLIRDAAAFSNFIQQQWDYAVNYSTSDEMRISEKPSEYNVHFDQDRRLQDLIPGLVRNGALRPVEIEKQKEIPSWAMSGVTRIDPALARFAALLDLIDSQLDEIAASPQEKGWAAWETFVRDWAELSSCLGRPDLQFDLSQKERYDYLKNKSDELFINWLISNYSSLGSQRLPIPHHVFHIPDYIAYLLSLKQIENIVLLVMDGMSLTDWQVIKDTWAHRYQDWKVKTSQVLAQIPTITSVSRFALISGLRPAEFIKELSGFTSESKAWELFWSRKEVPAENCKFLTLSYDRQIDQMAELQDPRIKFWCLVDDTIDRLSHNATLGNAEQQTSLRLWLDPSQDQNSLPLEEIIDNFLDRGYTVFVASDHGHTEATGIGQPAEGLLAQTRGKRARLYSDAMSASRIQSKFPNTILWERDGILPDTMVALMPKGREAFAASGEVVVSHGGISLEEVVVPLVQISKASRYR